ncbi:MAG: LysM peptidoglycan-binding domain-containing protein [Renibacterium sp.]|nr:LysM peptidoglycan-binding domain-containing protein [Renibacterium sp.]
MPFLTNLADVARTSGLRVVEIPGWQSRGYAGQSLNDPRGILWHHTATRGGGNMPTLNVLTNGRANLAGPLAQLGLGRDGTVYVVAAGLCNHAGRGQIADIPQDAGNYYLIGVEMEAAGEPPFDWTSAQLDAAPRLGAALERAYLMNRPPELRIQAGHKEYSSEGKIDPAGWPGDMEGLRASINALLAGTAPTPEAVTPPVVTPPPVTPAAGPIQWLVEAGETLAQVQAYYNGPTAAQIAAANGIADPDRIQVGQVLTIPGRLEWVVDPGDTLGSIAAYYRVSVDYLARLNNLGDPDKIQVGQVLRIQ